MRASACFRHNGDRGKDRSSAPPTPPYVRIRIRRFDWLCYVPSTNDGSPNHILPPSLAGLQPGFRFLSSPWAPRSLPLRSEKLHSPRRTEGQLFLAFLSLFTHEIRYLLTSPIVQAFAPSPELLCPLLTSALRSGCLSASLAQELKAHSVALPRHRTDLLG